MKEDQLFISLEEASRILGISKRAMTRLIESGKVRAKDVNASLGKRHQWIVLKQDVVSFDNV